MPRPPSWLLLLAAGAPLAAQERAAYVGAPIHYERPEREDAIARLGAALEEGRAQLAWDERLGWLPSLLETLGVRPSTQLLVFSKTSFQADLIGPRRPRALYFGDEVYVGWVPDAPLMELTAIDPRQGPTFYTLDQDPAAPRIVRRDDECLGCHASSATRGWPASLVRSVHPDAEGAPILRAGTQLTTQASPLAERWGGWYVTGTHGGARHLGNAVVRSDAPDERVDPEDGANVTDLSERVDLERYLTPHSDLLALMVLEHQARMHDLLAWASYEGRLAEHYERGVRAALGQAAGASASAQRRIERAAAEVVDHLLFRDEVFLTERVAGTSAFAREFAAGARRDSRGRSLRDLQGQRRLFRYPCSYLIHSPAFDALPPRVLAVVWRELGDVLQGRDVGRDFSHLSRRDRRAVLEILLETKAGLPEGWGG